MDLEIWKDIHWYEWLYQVSNLWKVKSLNREVNNTRWKRLIKERILKTWNNWKWYLFVNLSINNKTKQFYIHYLVTVLFLWERVKWYVVNHKDWCKNNNKISNLEYCTYSENEKHKYHTLWYKAPRSK